MLGNSTFILNVIIMYFFCRISTMWFLNIQIILLVVPTSQYLSLLAVNLLTILTRNILQNLQKNILTTVTGNILAIKSEGTMLIRTRHV